MKRLTSSKPAPRSSCAARSAKGLPRRLVAPKRRSREGGSCGLSPEARSAKAEAAKAGWTPERRARQAALIRRCRPWRYSTGPKTDAGKARVAMNAFRHGYRGRAWLLRARRIRNAIRLCADTVLLARVLMLQRDRLTMPSELPQPRSRTSVSRPQPPTALPGFAGMGQSSTHVPTNAPRGPGARAPRPVIADA
jgi:hypothetical protein